ncbi:MAG: LicD family protein [Chlamydiales bacterium]|nr:LicD family protein [Chlamydiales bacterium]
MESIGNQITAFEHYCLISSYRLGEVIDQSDSFLLSRIFAIGISAMCLLAESAKVVSDVERVTTIGLHTIKTFKIQNGNVQNGAMHVCEHVRNVAGVVAGSFLALFSPKLSRKLFLTAEAQNLQKKLTPDDAAKLYAQGFILDNFFVRHNLEYRICSGTVLGSERHRGVTPWDDDVDTMLDPNNAKEFKRLVDDGTFASETGLEIVWQTFTGGWECFYADSPKGRGLLENVGLPFIDIFCTQFNEKADRIEYSSLEFRQLSTEEYFTTDEWNEQQECTLGPVKMRGIRNSAPYIKRCYGPDAMDFAYQTIHHEDLAEMLQNPLNIAGNLQKISQYGLPKRTYITDRSPIEYNEDLFRELVDRYLLLIENIDS